MSTKRQALLVAEKLGFVLDERNTGSDGSEFVVIFDHPTHAVSNDCCSITVAAPCARDAWREAMERMLDGKLQPCDDSECDYHVHEARDIDFMEGDMLRAIPVARLAGL